MSATNRGAKRKKNDTYATPVETIEILLPYIAFGKVKTILEPCIGKQDRIRKTVNKYIKKRGLKPRQWRWAEIERGRDYLEMDFPRSDLCITNPPFSLAQGFIEKALGDARTVAYLLRLNYLGSKKRKDFWNSNPPDYLFPLSSRPKFVKNKDGVLGSDATEYAWFVWDTSNLIRADEIHPNWTWAWDHLTHIQVL